MDALSGLDQPARCQAGDRIVHVLLTGFSMPVEAVEPCEMSSTRSEPHNKYKITDPEGNEDWLCAWDVRKV